MNLICRPSRLQIDKTITRLFRPAHTKQISPKGWQTFRPPKINPLSIELLRTLSVLWDCLTRVQTRFIGAVCFSVILFRVIFFLAGYVNK